MKIEFIIVTSANQNQTLSIDLALPQNQDGCTRNIKTISASAPTYAFRIRSQCSGLLQQHAPSSLFDRLRFPIADVSCVRHLPTQFVPRRAYPNFRSSLYFCPPFVELVHPIWLWVSISEASFIGAYGQHYLCIWETPCSSQWPRMSMLISESIDQPWKPFVENDGRLW